MNVLAIGFCPPYGAIADNFVQFIQSLAKQVQLSVVCPSSLPIAASDFKQVYRIDYGSDSPLAFLNKSTAKTLQTLTKMDFDCVFFFTQHILNVPFALALKKDKQVMWWHEPKVQGRTTPLKQVLYTAHDFIMSRQANKIIVACDKMIDLVPKPLAYKTVAIPLPYLETFEVEDSQPIPVVNDILFFGNAEAYKGLDVLALALEQLFTRKIFVSCAIYGAGVIQKHAPSLLTLAQQFPDHIKVINQFQPHAEIVRAIRSSRAIVLPYHSATGTNTVQIAYRYQRPVIATSVGCLCQYVVPNETGWLIPPNDAMALAHAIEEVVHHPDQAEQLGISAYRSLARFTQPALTQQLIQTFAEVIR